MATMHRKRRVELYKSIFLFTFFIYNIYFLWEKTSAWGHSNPITYVLKMEGDYQYGFGCRRHLISFRKSPCSTGLRAYDRQWRVEAVTSTGLECGKSFLVLSHCICFLELQLHFRTSPATTASTLGPPFKFKILKVAITTPLHVGFLSITDSTRMRKHSPHEGEQQLWVLC